MRTKSIISAFLFLLGSYACCFASNPSDTTRIVSAYRGFSGGMMLHTGYLFGTDSRAPHAADGTLCSPQGAVFGIGGSLRIHLLNHLRVGCEGFVSTMHSTLTDCHDVLRKGSYIRSGWGGALADSYWQKGKAIPYVGGCVGGGAQRALYIIDGSQDDWQMENASLFNKQTFFYVSPYIGCDYCMTQSVHLSFRVDWMLALSGGSLLMPTGPRLYIGFMFCR